MAGEGAREVSGEAASDGQGVKRHGVERHEEEQDGDGEGEGEQSEATESADERDGDVDGEGDSDDGDKDAEGERESEGVGQPDSNEAGVRGDCVSVVCAAAESAVGRDGDTEGDAG